MEDRLSSEWTWDFQLHFLCPTLVHEKTDCQGNEDNREDDGPDSITPAPIIRLKECRAYFWSGPGRPEERQVKHCREKGTIEKICGIGNKDLLQVEKAIETCCPEDLRAGKGLNIVRGGLLNVANGVEEDDNAEGFKTAKHIGNFANRRFDDS